MNEPVDKMLPTLSIRQPWADLILWGVKDVENRSWSTSLRGSLLIHSSTTVDWEAIRFLERHFGIVLARDYQPQTGAILGKADLVQCVTHHESRFFSGPYGFVLRSPTRFAAPVPLRGRPGIFSVAAEILEEVEAGARAGA
ncbi:MAG TPA: ASCH domain-containing protein [Thermoanaerobaculia bacterium]|nr:ASCH domain-containing protein [Thermoanaerobaculia bacterium]